LGSFVDWFGKINWVSWDSIGSIGQIIGSIATVWTARVALGQMREARKQNELALRQIEEAREKEKEAMRPELTARVVFHGKIEKLTLNIILANNKPVPVYIDDMYTNISDKYADEFIETDAPKKVAYGDVSITKIQLKPFGDLLGDSNEKIVHFHFSYTTGEILTISFLLLKRSNSELEVPHFFYVVGEVFKKDEFIRQGNIVFPPYSNNN
jgi:hypothetical protein